MTQNEIDAIATPETLAEFGAGHLAYVRPILSEEAAKLYPQAAYLQPGLRLFTLHAADGTPIMIADSAEVAIANAWEHELVPLSVH